MVRNSVHNKVLFSLLTCLSLYEWTACNGMNFMNMLDCLLMTNGKRWYVIMDLGNTKYVNSTKWSRGNTERLRWSRRLHCLDNEMLSRSEILPLTSLWYRKRKVVMKSWHHQAAFWSLQKLGKYDHRYHWQSRLNFASIDACLKSRKLTHLGRLTNILVPCAFIFAGSYTFCI